MSVAAESKEVVRPLKTLEGLIKEDFEAAEKAGIEYYKAAGLKLAEAREGHFDGNTTGFYDWAQQKFKKKRAQIRTYMALVETSSRKSFKTLADFKRHASDAFRDKPTSGYVRREWTAPVDDIAERARREAFRLAQEDALTRAQEREAERKLALRLIDIGFKVLAKELHPDKLRGDRDAMQRLNRVRDKLRHCI